VQLHTPAALLPGVFPRYLFGRRLGGPQSRSGQHREMKILAPTGIQTTIPWSSSQYTIAISTALSMKLIVLP
jgi:hypothetical protein